uniref:Uncharacterized protein n=1 Tax=Anguilla anguilla TaxID=7936 RepID=A0A0E9PPI2_ANGAN
MFVQLTPVPKGITVPHKPVPLFPTKGL